MDNNYYKLKDNIFNSFCDYIKSHCGINLTKDKRILVEGRLQKVAKILKYDNINTLTSDFLSNKLLHHHHNAIIDAITTNTTEFFREPYHFDFLKEYILYQQKTKKYFEIWCAASSTGEEPYTIAITLSELQNQFNFSFNILATDISEKVLQIAKNAIYESDKLKKISPEILKKYFMISKSNPNLFKIVPEIKRLIVFDKLNLTSDFYFPHKFDVIFLRNVLIYFDDNMKFSILKKITNFMHEKSILFLGHSETITNKNLNLIRMQNTMYKLRL